MSYLRSIVLPGKPVSSGALRINRAHSLAQGLDCSVSLGENPHYNIVSGLLGSFNAAIPARANTLAGVGTDFPGGADNTITLEPTVWLQADRQFTLAIQLEYHVAAGVSQLLHLKSDEDDFQMITADGDAQYEDIAWGSPIGTDTWGLSRSGAGTVNPNELNTIVLSSNGVPLFSSYDLYVNGVSVTPAVSNNFLAPTVSANMFGTVTTTWFNGVIYGFRLWGARRLSDIEAKEVSMNFWQPFSQPLELPPWETNYFIPVGGAPPSGRIMSSLAGSGGLAGKGGIAGQGGGLAA